LSLVLAAAAFLTVSCATTPRETPATAEADRTLANAVYSRLNADPVYYFRHVEVRVDDGVAYLSGYVWSTDALYRARYLARSMPGVTRVVTSQLELERNGFSNGVAR
jgi:osmotically-inducible protein OsmY